jgi:subtilisin family serine protease
MDPVSAAQFLTIKDSLARRGTSIEAAYAPDGRIEYMYLVDRLLTRTGNLDQLQAVLPNLRPVDDDQQPGVSDLLELTIADVRIGDGEAGSMTVPEVLDFMDERIDNDPGPDGGEPMVSPVHVVHITKACPAGEPEVPSGYPTDPWPTPNPAGGGNGVKIGISDNGIQGTATAAHPWLANVGGEVEPPGPILPSGLQRLRWCAGHGTFGAGVTACMAPEATVYVNDHFTESAAEDEAVIIRKLEELIRDQSPNLICLPAGTYTRKGWDSLGFSDFQARHPNIPLIASAGNESTRRKFYPAAFSWVVGVGALSTDQRHRAWFSNYGSWVDVYALGEGIVNAYAVGEYTYQEPPKQPAKQIFYGMAQWEGTSFSAPLVAGLIAAEMARTPGSTAYEAVEAVLNTAQAQAISGVGPVLYPPHTPTFPGP